MNACSIELHITNVMYIDLLCVDTFYCRRYRRKMCINTLQNLIYNSPVYDAANKILINGRINIASTQNDFSQSSEHSSTHNICTKTYESIYRKPVFRLG